MKRLDKDSVVKIHNAVLAEYTNENLGARSRLLVRTTGAARADAALDRLLAFRDGLRGWLAEYPGVVPETVDVHLSQVTPSGVEVSVSLFLAGTTAAEETRCRDALTVEILRLAGELGLDLTPAARGELAPAAFRPGGGTAGPLPHAA